MWKYAVVAIAAVFSIYAVLEIVFALTHVRPLNDREIQRLSQKLSARVAKKNYRFTAKKKENEPFPVTPNGKTVMVYEILSTFPYAIAEELKNKKQLYVVFAAEKEGAVTKVCAYKENGKEEIGFKTAFSEFAECASSEKDHSVLVFYARPRIKNKEFKNLLPSGAERSLANTYAPIATEKGLNYFFFITGNGECANVVSTINSHYAPKVSSVISLQSKNGISKAKNYRLHRRLGLFRKW